MSQSRGSALAGVRSWTGSCVLAQPEAVMGRVSSTDVDGVSVWHLECWEFPIRALPCPQGLTDRYSSGPILCLVQSLSV